MSATAPAVRARALPVPRTAVAHRTWRVIGVLVTAVVAVLWLLPLLWTVDTAVRPEPETVAVPVSWLPHHFTLDAFRKVLAQGDVLRWYLNSTIVALSVTVLVLLLSSMAAYGLSRTRFRGRRALLGLIVAGIVVPPQALVIPLFSEMQSLGLVDTYWALILPQTAMPVMVYILKKFFDGLPRELEEAARVDGAGPWRVYWSVVLPVSRSVLAAIGIFTFVTTWNNFLWPFIAVSDPHLMTIPVGLGTVQSAYGLHYAQMMALALLGGLPLLIVYVLFQRQIVRGIAHTGLGAM